MENNNPNVVNDNHLSAIDRDERHPLMEPTSIPTIDNTTLNNIINSIIRSNNSTHSTDINPSGSTHVLLPVDLLVSIDNKSNIPTVQAALPSSFAIQQPLSLIQPPFPSIPNISMPTIPSFQMNTNYSITNTTNNIMINQLQSNTNANCNKSSLNPSAPSFTPSYPSYTMQPMQPMQPIAEVNHEINEINQIINNDNMSAPIKPIKDQWCLYDEKNSAQKQSKTETHLHSPKFKANKRFYNHNKSWRNHSKNDNKSWRNHNKNDNNNSNRWRNNNRFNNNRIIKLLAVFIKHVTLPNRHQYPPDTLLTKTWAMRNCGEYEWGYNVELVYCKGDANLSLHNRYPVKNAKCGEEIEISANIKTPKKSGRYCTYFRLQKNGRFFGPRVWVDIIVKSLDEMDKNISNNCGKQNNKNICDNNNDVSNVALSKKAIKWKKRKFGNAHNHYKVVSCK